MAWLAGLAPPVLLQPVQDGLRPRVAASPPPQCLHDEVRRPVLLRRRKPVNRMGVLPPDFPFALLVAADQRGHAIARNLPDKDVAPELPVSLHPVIDVLRHPHLDCDRISCGVKEVGDGRFVTEAEQHRLVRYVAHGEPFTFQDGHPHAATKGRVTGRQWPPGSAGPERQAVQNENVRSCWALTLARQRRSTVVRPARSRASNSSVTGEEA